MRKLLTRKVVAPVALFLVGALTGVGGMLGTQHILRHRSEALPNKNIFSRLRQQQETLNSLMKQSMKQTMQQTMQQIADGEKDFDINAVWEPFKEDADEKKIAIEDSGSNIIYRVPVENIKDKKVKVDVQDGMVTVTANSESQSKENTKGENSSTEELYSQYQKTFPLVAGANPAKMDFKIENDLIVIRFPKLKGV